MGIFVSENDSGEDVFDITVKTSNPEALKRWRKATLVLNAARRFRYTKKFREGEESRNPGNSNIGAGPSPRTKFRSTGHAVVAIHRFKVAGSQGRRSKHEVAAEEKISGFGVTLEELVTMNDDASVEMLQTYGGVSGLAKSLKTNEEKGITGKEEDLSLRRETYGENRYPEKAPKPFWAFVWEAAQDTTLIILMGCALISLVSGMIQHPEDGWYEGVGIGVAVIIVIVVTAVSDYKQSLQFRSLNAEKANIKLQVIRGGRRQTVSIYDLVVGDVVPLSIGDQVPGDGVLVSAHSLSIDESSMTGESIPRHKDIHRDPFLMSGCKVADGFGTMLVTGVGTSTEWGRVMSTLSEDNDSETPLQVRLNGVATLIGKVGLTVAVLVLLLLLIRYFANFDSSKSASQIVSDVVDRFAIAVTIVVVAIPEGLPLAVTLTLAYSMRKMMADKALVRKLAACETMGSATTICSDKTGTLTLNQMVVVSTWTAGALHNDAEEQLTVPPHVLQLILEGVAVNSNGSVFVPEDAGEDATAAVVPEVTASPTEAALLHWGLKLGMNFDGIRKAAPVLQVQPFNSAKKKAGVCVQLPSGNGARAHWKGAAEILLAHCSHWCAQDGSLQLMDDSKVGELQAVISSMAFLSLRCIALAYIDVPADSIPGADVLDADTWEFPSNNLVLTGIVGMKDPCRPGVPEAVRRCQMAGIKVRMVTGDNLETARAIAAECGILTPGGKTMEGREFRALSDTEMRAIIPLLDVLARSSPTDKHTLVRMLRDMGEVVAVTGDGTNDAPALHEADIGLAMGISGTEVAKESSDIIILDDNFTSIVKVVRWGRSVFANIQKFIQFQLTVNVVALVVNFVAACSSDEVPLTAVQLLWVNLIMDTLGALALATEPPTDKLLEQPPVGRKLPLISNIMWRNLGLMAVYQLTVFLTLNYRGKEILNLGTGEKADEVNRTIIFNAFVFSQLFNEINSRKPSEVNVFRGFFRNPIFVGVVSISVLFQVIIVEFLNKFASTTGLSYDQWLICIAIGSIALPWGALVKLIPVPAKPFSEFVPHLHLRSKRWGKRKNALASSNDLELAADGRESQRLSERD